MSGVHGAYVYVADRAAWSDALSEAARHADPVLCVRTPFETYGDTLAFWTGEGWIPLSIAFVECRAAQKGLVAGVAAATGTMELGLEFSRTLCPAEPVPRYWLGDRPHTGVIISDPPAEDPEVPVEEHPHAEALLLLQKVQSSRLCVAIGTHDGGPAWQTPGRRPFSVEAPPIIFPGHIAYERPA